MAKTAQKTRKETNLYRIPDDIAARARKRASELCRQTGRPVRWSDILREWLEAAAK